MRPKRGGSLTPTRAIVSRSTTAVAMATETTSELTMTAMPTAPKVRR